MINFTTYENYFEALATKHVAIEKFYPIDLDDMANATNEVRNMNAQTLLVLEAYAIGKHVQTSDQVFDRATSGYLVLKKLTNPRADVAAQRKAILNETEIWCNDFEARIKNDATLPRYTFLNQLQIESFNREKIGPVFDGYYGWRTTFRFFSYNPMLVLKSQWSDL
ncbi:hypothetical protein [uncultured Draconibacterium sp.]|uniref:hypothetical protein n=1 Tax=uncultured Draconibacterium sp. TaxID=1573823 RepID=UPI0025EBC995|nr:hypothetical protein [uncultured Draconibacterium sp.]